MADIDTLAYCSWMEARGDSEDAMRAVQHVIVKRSISPGFAHNIHDAVYGKNQFSWTLPNDPEHGLEPADGDPQYAYALSVAPAVLTGTDTDDPSGGALFYANEHFVTSGWYFNVIISSGAHPITATIGSLTFRQ